MKKLNDYTLKLAGVFNEGMEPLAGSTDSMGNSGLNRISSLLGGDDNMVKTYPNLWPYLKRLNGNPKVAGELAAFIQQLMTSSASRGKTVAKTVGMG